MAKKPRLALTVFLGPHATLTVEKMGLLEAIDQCGTISEAAGKLGVSYRQALNLLGEMNRAFGHPLIDAVFGGSKGGGATLSVSGRRVLDGYRAMEEKSQAAVAREYSALLELVAQETPDLKLSARTILDGKVVSIVSDGVMAAIKFSLDNRQIMTAVVTMDSLTDIKLRKGMRIKAIVKSSNVILGKDVG